MEPFTLFGIHNGGECYSCCPVWSKVGHVGILNEKNSIMDLWNSPKMQLIRESVLNDQLHKVCNFKYCPYAMRNENQDLESMRNDDPNFNRIIDQIMAEKTILDNPPYILFLANSKKCNLNCIMCDSEHHYPEKDELLDKRIFNEIIPDILPGISNLFMSGHGEVLLNPYSRKFLQEIDSSRYPHLRIKLLTNGTLFTPQLWKTISHNRYELISVSIDAATKDTYEKVRRNGKWDILRENLYFISELRRQNRFKEFNITFVVIKSNYHDMQKFVELGLELGCDKIIFQKVFGKADIEENINLTKNKEVFSEIGRILKDPIFNNPKVDTTLIEEYRDYADRKLSIADRLVAYGRSKIIS